jgi:hypothetical protein
MDYLPPDLEAGLIFMRNAEMLENRINHPFASGLDHMPIQTSIEFKMRRVRSPIMPKYIYTNNYNQDDSEKVKFNHKLSFQ